MLTKSKWFVDLKHTGIKNQNEVIADPTSDLINPKGKTIYRQPKAKMA